MKKYLFTFLIGLSFVTFSYASSVDICKTSMHDGDYATLQSNLMQTNSLLKSSQNLLSISNTMLNDGSSSNIIYVEAMLRLSNDIGTMADRIGTMADRIVATEMQIGIMADRILETQRIQNRNLALIQVNLLQAQKNFHKLLIQLK